MQMPETDAELEELRTRAFAIAYRMLGTVGDAEDVAQEAIVRLHGAREAGESIDSPAAYVATISTRLAIDELRSARARRETYVGEWLPEPLPTTDAAQPRPAGAEAFPDPADHAELADSLSLAFLVLLERLTPEQRAALLLHDVFDYSHEEVAAVIGKSPAATRQLATRARKQLDTERPRFQSNAERERELAGRFFDAVEDGDLAGLESLLADDVVLRGDGGGKAPALARALHGRTRAAKALRNWGKAMGRLPGIYLERAEFNGQPGAMIRLPDDRVVSAMAVETDGERITRVHSVVNPDKLGHLGETVDDYGKLLKQMRSA
jgi:RNA polymerase sigma-70 factor (ECF subfamily)